MAKHCRIYEHTADVGLEARADSLGELLGALAEGLADLICPRKKVRGAERRRVATEAEDVEALAVDFLTAVMVALQTDRFAVREVRVHSAEENRIEADLVGEPLDPARHEISTEVKAVTYHELRVVPERGRWFGRVIFDI